MPKQTNYNVGIYLRLSKDDERLGESVSIENQDVICQGVFLHLNNIFKIKGLNSFLLLCCQARRIAPPLSESARLPKAVPPTACGW